MTEITVTICAFPGCDDRRIDARGLCAKHYRQARIRRDIDPGSADRPIPFNAVNGFPWRSKVSTADELVRRLSRLNDQALLRYCDALLEAELVS